MTNKKYEFINNYEQPIRLDVFLKEELVIGLNLSQYSRNQLAKTIKNKKVLINGKIAKKPSSLILKDDLIEVDLEKEDKTKISYFDFPLNIVFEDDHIIVIDKPSNLVVHPGAGNPDNTLLNALAFYFKDQKDIQIELVHRLDKDTSGLIAVSKNEESRIFLSNQFQDRSASRTYLALCLLSSKSKSCFALEDQGVIETFVGRNRNNRLKFSVTDKGKTAITHWKKIDRFNYAALIEFNLKTGRTHQIRVHSEYLKSPIIGDSLYGDFDLLPKKLLIESTRLGRQALHAKELKLIHPVTKEEMIFKSDIPQELQDIIDQFKLF